MRDKQSYWYNKIVNIINSGQKLFAISNNIEKLTKKFVTP